MIGDAADLALLEALRAGRADRFAGSAADARKNGRSGRSAGFAGSAGMAGSAGAREAAHGQTADDEQPIVPDEDSERLMRAKPHARIRMPSLPAERRTDGFQEVACGYTLDMAVREAGRCVQCATHPCMNGCPVGVNIPEFIAHVAYGDISAAYDAIRRDNALPATCGRVCPQEAHCERMCIRGLKDEPVAIGRLERFVADEMMADANAGIATAAAPQPKGRVAVVGSGPSGLACAWELAQRGYGVTVFEAFHAPGGALLYGIPEFRLPKRVLGNEIAALARHGVRFELNSVVGRTVEVDELLADGYDAAYVAVGAGSPKMPGIPGENLNGVYTANEFLTRVNLMLAWRSEAETPVMKSRTVAVIGGGNVALDAARVARRLGAEQVLLLSRRTERDSPARLEEIARAKEEGIVIRSGIRVEEILDDGRGGVRGLRCTAKSPVGLTSKGSRDYIPIPGSEHVLPAACVILAVGQKGEPNLTRATPDMATDAEGNIVTTDESGRTTKPLVYAGGDAVTGAATVTAAMGAGKRAAAEIDRMLQERA